ncbi:MAG: hypothetical protein L6R39_002349 [Caloplaca ligustica]|nr:MAG: hypothetical protein L6R39_002349 [Caloplaca ligustica]
MRAQRWVKGTEGPELNCVRATWLEQQVLEMPTIQGLQHERLRIQIDTPLQSITQPRVVAASMGNIIRTLYTDGSAGDVVPASLELESAIDQWRADHEADTASVWALITPNSSTAQTASSDIQDLISTGSHIHRVVGGGGGWGKKRGLLALAPELSLDEPSESLPDEDSRSPGEERGQFLSPGDIVRFFVVCERVASPPRNPVQNIQGNTWELSTGCTSFTFGVVPSKTDVLPTPTTRTAEPEQSRCVYTWGSFGMLSEQMSFETTTVDGGILQTRLDSPYSMVSLSA